MNTIVNFKSNLTIFGTPILITLILVFLTKSDLLINHQNLAFGITFDFLITIPFVYFFLIRKTKIPKLTTYLFFFAGFLIASITLPTENQYYLSLAKKWLLPVLEGAILIIVLTKLIKGISTFKKSNRSFDFFTILKKSCEGVLPKKVITAFATEIAVFYYGFINWKKAKPKSNEFSYHKSSGIIGALLAVIFVVAIETFVLHNLIIKWNTTIAWIFTILSIYTAIQIFGFLKSITKRFNRIDNGTLYLRYGILCETAIDIKNIQSIEITTSDIPEKSSIKKFSAFGNLESHNLIIRLNEEDIMIRPYGFKKKFKELALFIDNKVEFKKQIENAL